MCRLVPPVILDNFLFLHSTRNYIIQKQKITIITAIKTLHVAIRQQEICFKFLEYSHSEREGKIQDGKEKKINSWLSQLHFPISLCMLVSKHEHWGRCNGHMKKAD